MAAFKPRLKAAAAMTSQPVRNPVQDHLLTPQNCALLIIDCQPAHVTSISSMDRRALVANVVAVAKAAKLFELPVVITTINVRSGRNQPTISQLRDVFPDVEAIDRTSINAWEDEDFVKAVKATGRKKLIMVSLWTEVCLAFAALDALQDGFEVYLIVDAIGGTSVEAHRAAVERMMQSGAQPASWIQLVCELQRDWQRELTAPRFAEIVAAAEQH
jgi:nicotinamidase-related amidase